MFLPRTKVIEMVEMTRTEECFLVQRCFFCCCWTVFVFCMGLLDMQPRGEQVKELEKCMPGQFFVPFIGMVK